MDMLLRVTMIAQRYRDDILHRHVTSYVYERGKGFCPYPQGCLVNRAYRGASYPISEDRCDQLGSGS